jgi:hypothetical protein
MQQTGYSLVDANGHELQAFGTIAGQMVGIPDTVRLSNGDIVHCPQLGATLSDGSKLVPRMLDDAGSPPWISSTGQTTSFDGTNYVVTISYAGAAINADILKQIINTECGRRIYAVASDNAQKNMSANAIAGNLSADDLTAFKNGTIWITAMQNAARALIVATDSTYADDSHWPVCPPEAAALAAKY